MISCETFRARFAPATEDAALLGHARTCDSCLRTAADIDPDDARDLLELCPGQRIRARLPPPGPARQVVRQLLHVRAVGHLSEQVGRAQSVAHEALRLALKGNGAEIRVHAGAANHILDGANISRRKTFFS